MYFVPATLALLRISHTYTAERRKGYGLAAINVHSGPSVSFASGHCIPGETVENYGALWRCLRLFVASAY